ncbi:mycofactocin biosynthesis chaperone MftB [Desertimonas flava]|uniref:mycofactocin biosynthesis chaperone MftB n=1 Tax=Desertimonas flava TaxID=2064846 RepID=UPI000E342BE1|nr:mycofactocin biosynthesis chaperone MftB [Desertimonas flava]
MTDRDVLDRHLRLDEQVALRPEPFGALAYHYGNRKLVFLRHPDVVRVVEALPRHATTAAALAGCGIAESRWPSFAGALSSLADSGLLVEVPEAAP